MFFLQLVFAALSAVSVADDAPAAPAVLPYLGYGYGLGAYPYALASPLTYTYTPQVTKFVPKEVPVEVKHIQYGIAETGCHNHFGFSVPCLQEGEARKKRSADEEAAAAPPHPAVDPIPAPPAADASNVVDV